MTEPDQNQNENTSPLTFKLRVRGGEMFKARLTELPDSATALVAAVRAELARRSLALADTSPLRLEWRSARDGVWRPLSSTDAAVDADTDEALAAEALAEARETRKLVVGVLDETPIAIDVTVDDESQNEVCLVVRNVVKFPNQNSNS